jgi:hypothetical protein
MDHKAASERHGVNDGRARTLHRTSDVLVGRAWEHRGYIYRVSNMFAATEKPKDQLAVLSVS